jgi:hypothetical protein
VLCEAHALKVVAEDSQNLVLRPFPRALPQVIESELFQKIDFQLSYMTCYGAVDAGHNSYHRRLYAADDSNFNRETKQKLEHLVSFSVQCRYQVWLQSS